ncbi:hypothetical protein [Coleofasciculus chthonoplastes]
MTEVCNGEWGIGNRQQATGNRQQQKCPNPLWQGDKIPVRSD